MPPPSPSSPPLLACLLLPSRQPVICLLEPLGENRTGAATKRASSTSLFLHTACTNPCVPLLSSEMAPIESVCVYVCVGWGGVGWGLHVIQHAGGVKALFSWSFFFRKAQSPLPLSLSLSLFLFFVGHISMSRCTNLCPAATCKL